MCTLVFAKYLMYLVVVLCVVGLFPSTDGYDCNEFVCGSVVSKCLIQKTCECELTDCSCCKSCFYCLGELYTECCSCLHMCPPDLNNSLSAPISQVGDFEGVPGLFDVLTADEDNGEWSTVRFPMGRNLQRHYNMATGSFGFGDGMDQQALAHKNLPDTVNCTVIYLNDCRTSTKCLKHCESMGANSYRWFHDGCCECVGANCFNYGINESRCTDCPDDDEDDENINDDKADYAGEDEDDEMNYN